MSVPIVESVPSVLQAERGDVCESLREQLALARRRQGDAEERAWQIEQSALLLQREVAQTRLAGELARSQSEMLIESLGILASASTLDTFLGHVLTAMVHQLGGVGGTLWLPDRETGTARLHLEYQDSRLIPASESHHPAVRHPPPLGGGPHSTFPGDRAEAYVLSYEVPGMPEENRAYIFSLGVRTLLTVPMILGRQSIGWICLRSRGRDVGELQSKVRVAEALAGQATLAVQMARLSDQARQAAILEERNRIARDIHDTLAQGFTGVVVNLEAAQRALRKDSAQLAQEHIDHARQLAQAGLEEARLSVRALRPDVLQQADLALALDTLVRRVEAGGQTRARLTVIGARRKLAGDARAEFLRIAQESVTNILKHAGAHEVDITLSYSSSVVSLSVADDGSGFDPGAYHEGFGLLGMQERAQRLGATLAVQTSVGHGTTVCVTLAGPDEARHHA